MTDFLKQWLSRSCPDAGTPGLVVLRELPKARAKVKTVIEQAVKDHLAGLDIIARIGTYRKALTYIRNKLPSNKRVRSGDFGEILATEYIDQFTDYKVPIRKLRWKDDREMAMRGNDVIAVRSHNKRWILLKAESKSRASLSEAVLLEAQTGLHKHSGRPNPSSLAFISSRLREQGRDDEAEIFETLQSRTLTSNDIEHMIFTVSGNDPISYLKTFVVDDELGFSRHLVGCVIPDHAAFITQVFASIYAGKPH